MGRKDRNDDDEYKGAPVKFINIIFLPFNPIFNLLVFIVVLVKVMAGPLLSVYPVIYCPEDLENPSYARIQFCLLFCDVLYGIDFFLNILHRQLTDEAVKRLHKKKSGKKLLLDLISLCPLYTIMKVGEDCPETQFWPNILLFSYFLIIYRVVEYFSLIETHSTIQLLFGYMVVLALMVNCISCLIMLLTASGLCTNCNDPNNIYDWRAHVIPKFPEVASGHLVAYIAASAFSLSFLLDKLIDEMKPATYAGFFISVVLLVFSYLFAIFIVIPKLFAEYLLRLRRICDFHARIQRIVEETKRRNTDPAVSDSVERFYQLMWVKHSGIPKMPDVLLELPRNLRIVIKSDLVWPVFYHSPIFRETSVPFKRWLGQYMYLEYKLPQERFFMGVHNYSSLYYLKSGIIQFISSDDASSPILSLTSGTLFGDIAFYCPPLHRNVQINCLTYCEIYTVRRRTIINALHVFPEDREKIIDRVWGKINHARTLMSTKKQVLPLNRSEQEDIDWIKQRWWQIYEILDFHKVKTSARDINDKIPVEHALYHCPKYIGQLVLCSDMKLKKRTLFATTQFPWVLLPDSAFDKVWRRIMYIVICLVLIVYPPSLIRRVKPLWFWYFDFAVTSLFFADVLVSLMTWPKKDDHPTVELYSNLIQRVKTRNFILDIMATFPVEDIAVAAGMDEMYYILKFNKLIKIYVLFTTDKYKEYDRKYNPMDIIYYKQLLIMFCFVYVAAYFLYEIQRFLPGQLHTIYLFGKTVCPHYSSGTECDQDAKGYIHVFVAYVFELVFNEMKATTQLELILGMCMCCASYILMLFVKVKFVSSLFSKYKDKTTYHYFVATLKKHLTDSKVHPDLIRRMDRHLMCHWKYFCGMDVINPDILKDEPRYIHWKFQGAVAENIIGSSKMFKGASRDLIKELGTQAKFLLIPRVASIAIFGVPLRNVNWIVNGQVRCEYIGENNEVERYYIGSGEMLCLGAVFFGTGSLRSYMTATDCEIITIDKKLFIQIIKRYPEDYLHIRNCVEQVGPLYIQHYKAYVAEHSEYKLTLRERIFHSRNSVALETGVEVIYDRPLLNEVIYGVVNEPESKYIFIWLVIRTVTVVASITFISVQGGSGAMYKRYLDYGVSLCRYISAVDILLKLIVLPHYDERGLVIRCMRKRILHYGARGLLADVVGTLPMRNVLTTLMVTTLTDNQYLLAQVAASYAHLYLLSGFFEYISNQPTSILAYMTMLKYQIYISLLLLGASAYFTTQCLEFTWTADGDLAHVERLNGCWVPSFVDLDPRPTINQIHELYAHSISLSQCGLTRMALGMFHLDREQMISVVLFVMLSLIYWYIISICQTLLVLQSRVDTLFSSGITQLRSFLVGERLDNAFIDKVVTHFQYWWMRSQGESIQISITDRISSILKEDLHYYCYKKTLRALDTMLRGGEDFQRHLCNIVTPGYFLPGEDVVREMDAVPYLTIVHRGSVMIKKNGKNLTKMTKGGIFGQFEKGALRPIRITAHTLEHTDLLHVNAVSFQEVLTTEVRRRISEYPHSRLDFMTTKKRYVETAANSVKYILRGTKTIHLPFMKNGVNTTNNWYRRWLYFTWLVMPSVAVTLSMITPVLPPSPRQKVINALYVVDFFHVLHIISEFYTTELIVRNNQCVDVFIGWKWLKDYRFYLDIISLTIPIFGNIFKWWNTNTLVRVLRLHLFIDYYKHFCKDFKNRHTTMVLKATIIILLFHSITCGWIYIGCRCYEDIDFPKSKMEMPHYINKSIDYGEWVLPEDRRGGCTRITRFASSPDGSKQVWFVVPRYWFADYILSLSFILVLYTHANMDNTVALTVSQVYYKVLIDLILYMAEMWISSITVSAVYTKYRDMYQFSYNVSNLVTYLSNNGLTTALMHAVLKYTRMLWKRQKGRWLPEITKSGPLCLQEDIFTALYLYHLKTPSVFQKLPDYFLRQMAVRLKRRVIFPGKYIVQEGDVYPCMYFIHEGEVEKYYKAADGELKLLSVLGMNGYFGLVPGLFPDMPFQFSYYSRTVVDLIFLDYDAWQDLLLVYSDIRKMLYKSASNLIEPILK